MLRSRVETKCAGLLCNLRTSKRPNSHIKNMHKFFIGVASSTAFLLHRAKRRQSRKGLLPVAGSEEEAALAIEQAAQARKAGKVADAIRIIHFNDVYNIEEGSREPVGGAARFVGLLRELSSTGLPPLVCFSGDGFNPSTMSTATRGRQMVPVLNECNIHTAVLGNHDFDFGLVQLKKLMAGCNFPWLLSNVFTKTDSEKPLAGGLVKRLVCWQGRLVGLVGLVEKEWLATLSCVNPDDVVYCDFVSEGRKLAKSLKDAGAEIVIALTHMRLPNDVILAEKVKGIDIILGGHDHHYEIRKTDPHGTIIFKSGTDFRQLTDATLAFKKDGTIDVTTQRYDITTQVEPDKKTAEIVDSYFKVMEKKMKKIIGEVAVDLECRFSKIRTQETNVGNWICDIVKEDTKADVVLINSGTLRADCVVPSGPYSIKDLISLLPMPDPLAIVEIKGSDLILALENSVSKYPRLEGRFAQVSGVKFKYKSSRKEGNRVDRNSVHVGGELIDVNKRYSLCTKEYLLKGKDGYTMLANQKLLVDAENLCPLPTMVRNYFKKIEVLNKLNSLRFNNKFNSAEASGKSLKRAAHSINKWAAAVHAVDVKPEIQGRIVCLE